MSERPSMNDRELHDETLDALVSLIEHEHHKGARTLDVNERQQLNDALIADWFALDGYTLARALEADGWKVDAHLVALLDTAREMLRKLFADRVQAWAREAGIDLHIKQGDRVLIEMGYGRVLSGVVDVVQADVLLCHVVVDGKTYVARAESLKLA